VVFRHCVIAVHMGTHEGNKESNFSVVIGRGFGWDERCAGDWSLSARRLMFHGSVEPRFYGGCTRRELSRGASCGSDPQWTDWSIGSNSVVLICQRINAITSWQRCHAPIDAYLRVFLRRICHRIKLVDRGGPGRVALPEPPWLDVVVET
jgi:hypothetical protein